MSDQKEIVPDPELESLLDDAFQDFSKPPKPNVQKSPINTVIPNPQDNAEWTEEFIKQQTQNFEATLRAIMQQQQQGLTKTESVTPQTTPTDTQTPPSDSQTTPTKTQTQPTSAPQVDFDALNTEFAKFAEAAAKAASEETSDSDFASCLANTMKQLADNNEQLKAPPSSDDMTKMFETMGLGGMAMDGDNEMGGLFPLMQNMLQNILSKDVIYPPLKEIVDKYPDWLADNRPTLKEEDYERYNSQFDMMKKIVDMFEEEKPEDSEETKAQRFEKILQSMQKLQDYGQPPQDLVGEFGNMPGLDGMGSGAMPDPASLLAAAGLSTEGGPNPDGTEQCSVM